MIARLWFRASRCFASIAISWCVLILFAASSPGQTLTSPVGTASATQTATVTITTAGTLANIFVLTQGATGLDFNAVSPNGGTCAAGAYNLGDTCTVQYTFTPTHPWVRYGSVSLTDSTGVLLGNVFLSGLGTGPQVSYPLSATSIPSPLASGFSSPVGIAVDAKGNVYLADTGNNAIKELVAVGGVIPSNPTITTLASGLNAPTSVTVDGAGNVYFADSGNNAVKEIVAVGGVIPATPTILTLGSGFAGPKAVAVDGSGNIYVADTLNDAVKEIVAVNGVIPSSSPTINTLGSGFMAPAGVFADSSGNVFVADTGHSLVKEIVAVNGVIPSSNPTINTLGSGFSSPRGVSLDGSGNVYVADTGNSLIREISGSTILTLGTGFTSPNAVALDSSGNVFVTDNGTNPVTEMSVQTSPSLTFAATALGATSSDSPKSYNLMNNGNAALIFSIPTTGTNPSISANFNFDATTTCPQLTTSSTATGSLNAGSSCIDAINFAPSMAGSPLSGFATSTDNNLNTAGSSQTISLSGTGNPGTPGVTVTPASVPVNTTSVTLAATVSYAGVVPTGSVTFSVNSGTAIAAACTGTSSPLSCTASYNPSSLTAGAYTIQVSIASDGNYNGASGSGTLTITKGTPALSVSPGTSTVNDSVTLTAVITPNSGIVPAGTVSFSTTLNSTTSVIAGCSARPLTSGPGSTLTATCPTSALLAGSNSIVATLASDSNFNSASSPAVTQTVNQGTPVLALSPTSGSSTVNDTVTFTVTVTPNNGIVPSGTVTFNTALGAGAPAPISGCSSLTLGANGAPALTAICTTTSLLAGSNAITATIAADANFVTATSNAASQTVAKANPALTLTQSAASSMVNELVTFTVAVTPSSGILPGGRVTFSTAVGGGTANAIVNCTSIALVSGAGPTLTASCPTRALLAGSNVVTAVIVSDANFNAATSNSVTQTVSRATTSLALTSSQPTSSTVDQAVTFTATISQPSGNPFTTSPGGTVSFTANSTVIATCGTSSVDPSTHAATCVATALVAPSDVIVATYSSDNNFVASTSPQLTQIVNKNTPAISVVSDQPTTAVVNQTVTFTATIAPPGASATGVAPTGNVTFTRNSANLCSPVVVTAANGNATATCQIAFATVLSGATIVATYSGDSNFIAGTANVSQTVLKGGTTTTVTSATNPSVVNQSVNLTATVTAANAGMAAPVSGSLTFIDSLDPANPFCTTNSLTVSGSTLQATCPHVFASSGNHIVTAAFTSSDPNFNNSTTANSVTQVVGTAGTTLTVANTASTTPTVNQTATFQATFSSLGQAVPQGSVTYSDGATPICQNLQVMTGGTVPPCMITFLTAGDHFITAAFTSTDSNFANVTSAQLRQTVNKNTPSVGLASNFQTSAAVNQQVTFTATVTPAQVISSGLSPTGSVTFNRGQGGPVLCSAISVNPGPGSTATASCTTAFASVYTGTAIVATYSGDTNFLSGGGTVAQTVLKGATSTTVTSTINPSAVNQSVVLTVAVTPSIAGPASPQSGSVVFADSLDSTHPFCSNTTLAVVGGVLTGTCNQVFASFGNHIVTANFTSSDLNFNNSTTANGLPQSVGAATIALTVTSASTPSVNQQATFQATISPIGPAVPQGMVSYSDGTTTICPNAMVSPAGAAPSCTATFLTAGSHSITATFTPTDNNFQQTTSAAFPLTVSQNTPTVTITSPAPTFTATVGQDQTFTATVTPSANIGNTPPTGSVTFYYSVVTSTGTTTGTICTTGSLTASGIVGTASCPLTPLILAGRYTITAQYSRDSNFNAASSAALMQTVGQATTSLTVGPLPSAQINTASSFKPALSITSMIDPSGTGTTQPTGTFTLTDGQGASALSVCNVQVAAGVIACPPYTFPTAGSHTLYATYSGDANFSGSSVTSAPLNVATASPTVTVTSSSLTSVATQAVTFTATVAAGQTVPTNANGNITFSITQGGIASPFTCSSFTPQVTNMTNTATCIVTAFGTNISGNVTVTATYKGDSNYNAVTSPAITQTVQNFTAAVTPQRVSLAQGTASVPSTNLTDPYSMAVIQSSIAALSNFTDATVVSACTFVDSSNNPITVPGLSCAPVAAAAVPPTIAGAVVTSAAAPVGDYTLQLTFTDQARVSLSHTATTTITILSQPATIQNFGVGTSAVTFTVPPSLAFTSPFSCNSNLKVYNSTTKTYSSSTTLNQVGITCSSIASGSTAGTYSFTISATGATAKLDSGPGKIFVAFLGAPFLLLIGFFPSSRKYAKAIPRLFGIVLLLGVSMSVMGCGGGGFTRTSLSTTVVNGSYLIQIMNAQGVTVAEVPLVIGSGS